MYADLEEPGSESGIKRDKGSNLNLKLKISYVFNVCQTFGKVIKNKEDDQNNCEYYSINRQEKNQ